MKDESFSETNNPAQMALAEVGTLFPGQPIGCFVSIGLPIPHPVRVGGSLSKIVETCTQLSINCEKADHSFRKRFRATTPEGQENPYYRFSVNGSPHTILLKEWDHAEELAATSQQYMSMDLQKKKVANVVDALIAVGAG